MGFPLSTMRESTRFGEGQEGDRPGGVAQLEKQHHRLPAVFLLAALVLSSTSSANSSTAATARLLVGLKLAPPTAADVALLAKLSDPSGPRVFLGLAEARAQVRLADERCRGKVFGAIARITEAHGGRRLAELPDGGVYSSYALTPQAMDELFPSETFRATTATVDEGEAAPSPSGRHRRRLLRANPEGLMAYLRPDLRACVGYITMVDRRGTILVDDGDDASRPSAEGKAILPLRARQYTGGDNGRRQPSGELSDDTSLRGARRTTSASPLACALGRPFACNGGAGGNHQCDAGIDAAEECVR